MFDLTQQVSATIERMGASILQASSQEVVFCFGDRIATLSLTELTKLCADRPPEVVRVLIEERIAQSLKVMSGQTISLSQERLFPRLRPVDDVGSAWSMPEASGQLALCLIVDGASSIRYLSPMDVVGLGVGLAQAKLRALENLRQQAPQGCWVESGAGLLGYRSKVLDGHDGTRILVADHWFADPHGLFVLAPTRDLCFVLPASTPGAVSGALELRSVALDLVRHQPYAISPEVFWLFKTELIHIEVSGVGPGARFRDLPLPLVNMDSG